MSDPHSRLEKSIQNLGPDLHPDVTEATSTTRSDLSYTIALLEKKIQALEIENHSLREGLISLWQEMRDQIMEKMGHVKNTKD